MCVFIYIFMHMCVCVVEASPGGRNQLSITLIPLTSDSACTPHSCSKLNWVGGRTEFTQSRKDRAGHDRSRNSEGLQGVERDLVEGDAKSPA